MRLYTIMLVAGAIFTVMAGHSRPRTASYRSPMSRPSTPWTAAKKKDVDARDKPGHDVERFVFRH
jgi:hypothetical protein